MNKVLDVQNLHVSFDTYAGEVKAVRGVTFSLSEGEVLAIVGESGCGKSVTSLSIMGLLGRGGAVVDGSVLFANKNLLDMDVKQLDTIRGNQMTMIFQDPLTSLNPVFTIGSQITESIRIHMHLSKKEAGERAVTILEKVGMPDARAAMKKYPHMLSGGMRQRVMIAMALCCNPKLLIADEPTTALDVTIQAQVLEMMKGLRDKYNTSMLMITHDLGIVAEICDEVSVVYAGRVIEHGTLEDIFKNTRHPYTEGLFNSLPNLENRQAELKPIKGLMPDPSNLPKGCAFCPRCEYATEICKTQKPPRTYRNDTHYVECHLYNKDNIHEGKVNIR